MNKGTMEGIRPLEQWIEKMMAHYEAAGLAVAVVDKNVTLYQKFFGFRDAENQTPIDENTIFGLASVSKSFTALSIMQLAEKGVIDLWGPVSRYLPEFQNAHAAQPVTVAHLLSHAGGFLPKRRMLVEEVARDLGIWQDGKAEIGPHPGLAMEGCRRVCKGLDEEEARTGLPGEYMSYSNDSYGLLSEIIRRYGGENSFQDYLEKNVFAPLGMDRATGLFIAPAQDPNSTKLYFHKDGKRQWCRDYYDNAFVLMGGGAVKASLGSMKKYVQMYLNEGKGEHGRLLSPYGIREMMKPRQHYRYGQWYGYGVAMSELEGVRMVGHGGSMTGISSHFAWSPELEAGVIVLCNTSGVPVSRVAEEALRWVTGAAVPAPMKNWQDAGWSEEEKKSCLGKFRNAEGNEATFTWENGDLHLTMGGKEREFIMAGHDLIILPGEFSQSDILLLREEGRGVWGVRTGGRILTRE